MISQVAFSCAVALSRNIRQKIKRISGLHKNPPEKRNREVQCNGLRSDSNKFTYKAFSDDFSYKAASNEKWKLIADSVSALQNSVIQYGEYVLDKGIHANIKDMEFDSALYEGNVKVENGADWIGLLFNKEKRY